MNNLVDTNILVRLIVDEYPDLTAQALKHVKSQSQPLLVTDIVLAELIYVLNSYYEFKRKEIYEALLILETESFVFESPMVAESALLFFRDLKLHFVDCWLLAKSGIDNRKLVTLDRKLNKKQVI